MGADTGPEIFPLVYFRALIIGSRSWRFNSSRYTDHALRAFIEAGGETGANAHHLGAIVERWRLLASADPLLDSLRLPFPSAYTASARGVSRAVLWSFLRATADN
jgi:hypothetical protein